MKYRILTINRPDPFAPKVNDLSDAFDNYFQNRRNPLSLPTTELVGDLRYLFDRETVDMTPIQRRIALFCMRQAAQELVEAELAEAEQDEEATR